MHGTVIRVGLLSVALGGCYYGGEAGYTNAYTLRNAGGASLVARAGFAEFPNHGTPQVALDLATRLEATATDTRVTLGPSLLLAPSDSLDRQITPFARPGAWLALARFRDAERDFWLTPSLDIGAFFAMQGQAISAPPTQLYQVGLRTEYLAREGDPSRSFAATLYLGFGYVSPR